MAGDPINGEASGDGADRDRLQIETNANPLDLDLTYRFFSQDGIWAMGSSLSGAFDRCLAALTAGVVVALWSIWPIGPPGMKDQLG